MQTHTFWGKKDTSISFCEKPYEESKYIAEFYNTISAFSYILTGIFFYFTKIKKIGITLLFLGLGTAILHGTQRYYGQIMDELSMLVFSFFIIEKLRLILNKPTNRLILYSISALYIASYNIFSVFLIVFVTCQVYICYLAKKILRISENITHVKILLINSYIITFLISFVFWIIDQSFCNVYNIQLHALWHVGTSISIFLGLLFLII